MLPNKFWKFWNRTSQSKPTTSSAIAKPPYEELTLGVWRVLVAKDQDFSICNFQWESFTSNFPLLRRAIYDVYTVSPRLFFVHVVVNLWSAVETPLSLYFSNRLFFCIENRLLGGFAGNPMSSDLHWAVIAKIACSTLTAYMWWLSQKNRHAYSSLVKYEFQARLFSADLSRDLPTSQDLGASNINTDNIYDCLEQGTMLAKNAVSFLLHIHLITRVIGNGISDGGPAFTALCMLPALMKQLMSTELWGKAYVVDAANRFFIRKAALGKLVESSLKQEVMAGGVSRFLTNEYRKAKDGLGDTPDTSPEFLYTQNREALLNIVTTLCADAPTLYFAFLALIRPSTLSIVQLALLNQTSTSLRYTFAHIGWSIDQWPAEFSRLRNVYAALEVKNEMKDGQIAFPRPGYEESAGMSIEVRDVSFSYPSSKSERAALSGVSFTIQPGQLVVVVGANGSGKSTIIKLLSRFYDRTSGDIWIDGIPIEDYKMDELRKGVAMLTQEHQLFPLSVKENIQLGSYDAEVMNDEEKIKESASAAGADGLIKNLSDQYGTVLEPVKNSYLSYGGQGNRGLEAIHKKMEKPTSISGGEKQKLVAARTFMRLLTSPVKLVTVDEPSSALDPEAEYRLFANLRQARKGRTMIFVTHRFGHLTKHADLIICIKDGTVVETGTHVDLLAKEGEYAHLYNIQAQAFTTTS